MPKRVPGGRAEDKMLETGAALTSKERLSVDVKGVEMLADLLLGRCSIIWQTPSPTAEGEDRR